MQIRRMRPVVRLMGNLVDRYSRFNLAFGMSAKSSRYLAKGTCARLLGILLGICCTRASADEASMQTFTYKAVPGLTNGLQADVHRPPGDAVRPVVIFIHGGALMMGSRKISAGP